MTGLPPHPYVPGRTERHPEGAFDALRETAAPGMTPEALSRSEAFRAGLLYLGEGYFWEAHELLEPVWMALPDGPERRFVQGLIQLANGLLKVRMGRPKAARRLSAIAAGLLDGPEDHVMGVERAGMMARARALGAPDDMHYKA